MKSNIVIHDRREEKTLYMPPTFDYVIEVYDNNDMVAIETGQETGKNEYLLAHQNVAGLTCTQIDVYIYDFGANS